MQIFLAIINSFKYGLLYQMLGVVSVSLANTSFPLTKRSAGAEAGAHHEAGRYFDSFDLGGGNGGNRDVYGGGLGDVYGLGGGATYNHYHYGGGGSGGTNQQYYGEYYG